MDNRSRVHRALDPGTSILVASVDGRNTPSCCRGIALASTDDLATAMIYVPLATSQQTLQNVATTRRLAVVASHPIDHCSIQLKGTTVDVRLARDEEAPFVADRLERLAEVLERVGVPKRLVRRVSHWPAFVLTMRVERIFDQTPGPHAGCQLQ
jgi:hypothetical protein